MKGQFPPFHRLAAVIAGDADLGALLVYLLPLVLSMTVEALDYLLGALLPVRLRLPLKVGGVALATLLDGLGAQLVVNHVVLRCLDHLTAAERTKHLLVQACNFVLVD